MSELDPAAAAAAAAAEAAEAGMHPLDAETAEADAQAPENAAPRPTVDGSIVHQTPSASGGGTFTVTPAPAGMPTTPPAAQILQPVPAPVVVVADLDLDQLNTISVKLGGRVWQAIEPTIGVSKKLAEALPTIERGEDVDEDDENAEDIRAEAVAALESIIPQVQEVLRDPSTGERPTAEFIETYLTGRNFGRLMERLNAEEEKAGPTKPNRAARRRRR